MSGLGVLLVRCDATIATGTGHVMRCLALAQAWQDAGGRAAFAMAEVTPAVESCLKVESCDLLQVGYAAGSGGDAQETLRLAREQHAEWIVVDGYCFGSDFQAALKNGKQKVLFVDDKGHAGHYSADIVLNQNPHASATLYQNRESHTRLLLGPRYALLRREFVSWRGWKRKIPEVASHVLVTMGGSDPDNVTEKVMEAILPEQGLTTTVIAGGSNPHLSQLRAAAARDASRVRLLENVTNMPELMAKADIAVAGAGTTCWEMCLLGLPAIVCVLADNQEGIASSLDELGMARSIGQSAQVSTSDIQREVRRLRRQLVERKKMCDAGQALVDGCGAARMAALLQNRIHIRRTTMDDCRSLWNWANDPEMRAASFSTGLIPWESHVTWLQMRLADPCATLYTATYAGNEPIGQVRFQTEGTRSTLSIGLAKTFRGCGWGRTLLFLACEVFFCQSNVETIDAYVKPENETSVRLFSNAGFQKLSTELVCEQPAIHFVLQRRAIV